MRKLLILTVAALAFGVSAFAVSASAGTGSTVKVIMKDPGCHWFFSHGKYVKCVKSTLKLANLTALIPDKACRKLITQCESASICHIP